MPHKYDIAIAVLKGEISSIQSMIERHQNAKDQYIKLRDQELFQIDRLATRQLQIEEVINKLTEETNVRA